MKGRLLIVAIPTCFALAAVVWAIRPTPRTHEPDVVHRLMIKNGWPERGPSIIRLVVVVRTEAGPPPPMSAPSNWRALAPKYEDSSDTWEMHLVAAPGTAIQTGSSQGPFLARAPKDGLVRCDLWLSDGTSFSMHGCPLEVGQ